MGVEYKQFLIPADPAFIPQHEVLIKIDTLLSRWHLKTGNPKLFSLANGENTSIHQDLNSIQFGHGIAVEYPGVEGRQVREVVGQSYFKDEVSDEDRYMERIILIVGTDYRIHPGSEEVYIKVNKPPVEEGKPVKHYCEFDELYGLHAEAYNCSINATPPDVHVSVEDKERIIGDQNFLGYWRTALVFDFGKDLPALGDKLFKLENEKFLDELERAFECPLIQIGEIY
jgi:hypothetical protein